jgi:SpoIID/LytB domain protein
MVRTILSRDELPGERAANRDPDAFWQLKEREGFSFASGAQVEWGPVRLQSRMAAVRTIRIGLNPTRFSDTGDVLAEFDTATEQRHRRITLTATGPFTIAERAAPALADALGTASCGSAVIPLAIGRAGEEFAFTALPEGILITAETFSGISAAPLCVEPAPGALLVVTSLRRRNLNRAGNPFEPPQYRGVLEVRQSRSIADARTRTPSAGDPGPEFADQEPQLRLLNVLDLEEYLQGVVTNEMPASFHPEALRAQAVAARTFALANLGRFASRGFDLDDSTLSQVYRGVLSEHPNGNAAVHSTRGLVVVREGMLVPTFYSSSMGGHTESNEWIFNSPADRLPGSNAHPALRALHDGDFPVPVDDLTSDQGAFVFYSQVWDHYDSPARSGNPRYRWVVNRSAAFIAERVRSLFGVSLGPIVALIPLLRSPSGRIVRMQIVGAQGTLSLHGWRSLRDFFQLWNSPSALLMRQHADGTVSFDLYGGGWGHNVGMSQYGAHGRGRSGQSFREILAAYYAGAEVISVEDVLLALDR